MQFELSSFISIVFSLIILEMLLSADNALVNASIAKHLPVHQRVKALRIGITLGAAFRLIALLFVNIIIQNAAVRIVGALYLMYLASNHLELKEQGRKRVRKPRTFKGTIWQIALADLAFGIDSVITAVGFSDNLFYIYTGVIIGMIGMVILSPVMLKVIGKFPHLSVAAYVIVGLIGTIMLLETLGHIHVEEYIKFSMVLLVAIYAILYERNDNLRRISDPILHKLRIVLSLPSASVRYIRTSFSSN